MTPLFFQINSSSLCRNVHNEVTMICAPFGNDLFNIFIKL